MINAEDFTAPAASALQRSASAKSDICSIWLYNADRKAAGVPPAQKYNSPDFDINIYMNLNQSAAHMYSLFYTQTPHSIVSKFVDHSGLCRCHHLYHDQ